ncbi:MAG: hypothetical protein EON87_07170 [Brevundimonas sp.]|nr:MAG: hypothetical protein EON87_07170 [Brevundimonas sp.]
MEGTVTSNYLPVHLYSAVETLIQRKAVRLAGPIVDPADIDARMSLRLCAAPVATCVGSFTERFPDGPTYFALVDSPSPTAMIGRFTGFQCVVVSLALHDRLARMATVLLGWQPLRDYLLQGTPPPTESGSSTRSRLEAIDEVYAAAGPLTAETGPLFSLIGFLGMYFIAAHEVGHLALGHLDSAQFDEGFIEEISDAVLAGNAKAASRAMEWDADVFAGAGTVWWTGFPQVREDWAAVLPDKLAGLRAFLVTAYFLFTVMDHANPATKAPEDRTHPAPLVRATLMAVGLAAVLGGLGGISVEEALEESRAAIRATEIALHEVAGGMMEAQQAQALQIEFEKVGDEVSASLKGIAGGLNRDRLDFLFWAAGMK